MAVSKTAIAEWLARPLRDSAKAKEYDEATLLAKCAELVPPAVFHTKPRVSQLVCFLLAIRRKFYGMLLDMGAGKSKTILDIYRQFIRSGEMERGLVVVPFAMLVEGWRAEAEKHAPDLKCAALLSNLSSAAKEELFWKSDAQLVIITYAGLVSYLTDRVTEGDEKKTVLDEKLLRQCGRRFGAVTFDESQTQLRSHTSITFRMCRMLSGMIPRRFILTGTVFGKDPTIMWSQIYLVDRGEALGETIGLFRAAFFKETRDYWSGGFLYKFKEECAETLHRMMRHSTIRYTREELAVELPPMTEIRVPIIFTDAMWKHYDKLEAELTGGQGSFTATGNSWMRMRQVLSGYLGFKDAEDERHEIKFEHNPKLDALDALLAQIPEDSKVLIFNEYVITGDLICERLKQKKVKHERLYGKTKNKPEALRRAVNDKSVRAAVVNLTSGGTGLNLQAFNYVIFFEIPHDPIVWRQALARAHRPGQTLPVTVYYLLVKGSLDIKIMDSIEAGVNLFEQVVNGKVKVESLFKH